MYRIGFAVIAAALFSGANAVEAQRIAAAKEVPPGHRPPRGMCRVWIDGVPPGRQPAVTDCFTARTSAPRNSRVIYGDLTPFPGQGAGKRDCRYEERRSTVGDIIFGRRAADRDAACRFDTRRQFGSWYEIGRDSRGVSIFQRIMRLQNGTVLLQRGYMRGDGSLVAFDTRYPGSGVRLFSGDDDMRWANSAVRRGNASPSRLVGSGNRSAAKAKASGESKTRVARGKAKGKNR